MCSKQNQLQLTTVRRRWLRFSGKTECSEEQIALGNGRTDRVMCRSRFEPYNIDKHIAWIFSSLVSAQFSFVYNKFIQIGCQFKQEAMQKHEKLHLSYLSCPTFLIYQQYKSTRHRLSEIEIENIQEKITFSCFGERERERYSFSGDKTKGCF